MPDSLVKPKTVAVIGAGPVGLAAAAHLLERGLEPVVIEAGPTVGHAVRQWGHVQTFSPWEFNIDKAAERLLTATGWNPPQPDHYPTGAELVEQYLEPLATRTPLKDRIRTNSRVTAIGRVGFDKMKTKGREAGTVRDPLPERQRPGEAHGRRRHRCDRHLVLAQSRRRQRLAGDRRGTMHANVSPTACPTCWAATARATPAARSQCWAAAIPPSAR